MKTEAGAPDLTGVEMVIRRAYEISEDIGHEVERLVAQDVGEMAEEDARALYTEVVQVMKRAAIRRGDRQTAEKLAEETEAIVNKVMQSRSRASGKSVASEVDATAHGNGSARPQPPLGDGTTVVTPRRVFHGRKVDLYERKVSTREIQLWAENERLDVHLEQFRTLHGRTPNNDELFELLCGTLTLPGVGAGDERRSLEDPFLIRDLADNIAKNGLRTPPILDSDGETLLDGNRRVTACYFILTDPDYTVEQKKLVEEITVWQLTEHADDDDREAVIVALNFEDDCKVQWPDYVRAKKVRFDYDMICMRVGQQNLDQKRERKIRQELAKKYALKMNQVGMFLTMTTWIQKFETYHIDEQGRDEHEVRHLAKNKFSYFKELSDIDDVLLDDDEYRDLVFDLLFQGKFKNWESVRRLRFRDDQLDRDLRVALAEPDSSVAKKNLGISLDEAYKRHQDRRPPVGVNERIESFAEFVGKLPPSAYLDPDTVTTERLRSLRTLCTMVIKNVDEALKARGVA
ncbi:MAG TPA: hypothetical protein VFJ82_01630 [Longimicrobium sp.]|nr:hypothetical protein [Longimicrobium sp.]